MNVFHSPNRYPQCGLMLVSGFPSRRDESKIAQGGAQRNPGTAVDAMVRALWGRGERVASSESTFLQLPWV